MIPNSPSGFVPDPRITEYPGTMIRDWIMLCSAVPDPAYRAYSIIRAHIWEKDVRREVRLTQADIAEMISKSEERTRKILKPLLKVGLLAIAEKREWWEYNPKLKRRERRTMNIYAVMDFPPEGYDGPKSVKDFRDRFSARHRTDRSETTGRSTVHVSAGQTDRPETTGGLSSQVSDIPAGQTDRSKMTTPAVKNDRPYKNLLQEREGEEGDARARVTDEPSADEDPVWGVQGGTRFAAPSLASAHLIRDIASQALLPGESLSAEDHQRLAALVEAARPVVEAQPGLSWDEYEAWLHQGWVRPDGRRTFRSLPGALAWRLAPDQIRGKAWPWACEQRGAQEPSEARGERDMPTPQATVHAGTCGHHKVALTEDGKCLRCEHEEAQEFRQREQDHVDYDEAPGVEEIAPEELAQMYRSIGTPPTEAWQAARRAMEEARAGGQNPHE